MANLTRKARTALRWIRADFYKIGVVRLTIVTLRYFWYKILLRRMKIHGPAVEAGLGAVIQHNIKQIRPWETSFPRIHNLTRTFVSTVPVHRNLPGCRVLTVGPRGESELYILYSYGFSIKNVTGLDLFSYSPRVQVGDMHDMPFADDSFDVVLAGWVLAYTDERKRACQEILRVVRDGGIVSLGVIYSGRTTEDLVDQVGDMAGYKQRMYCVDDILAPFGDAVDHVYFNQDIEPSLAGADQDMMVTFRVKK